MKLLSEDILSEFGFFENKEKTTRFLKVYTRDNLDITLKEDGEFYYSSMGINYPLKDLSGLRKFYKEVRREELKPL